MTGDVVIDMGGSSGYGCRSAHNLQCIAPTVDHLPDQGRRQLRPAVSNNAVHRALPLGGIRRRDRFRPCDGLQLDRLSAMAADYLDEDSKQSRQGEALDPIKKGDPMPIKFGARPAGSVIFPQPRPRVLPSWRNGYSFPSQTPQLWLRPASPSFQNTHCLILPFPQEAIHR